MYWQQATILDYDLFGRRWYRQDYIWRASSETKKMYTPEETKGRKATNPPRIISYREYLEDGLSYCDDGYYAVSRRLLPEGVHCRTLHRTLIAVESLAW